MLTILADQQPIYILDLHTLQDQVNAIQNQMDIVIEDHNNVEAVIFLLPTKLAEAHNIANVLVYVAAAPSAATPMHTIDKIPFSEKFNSTRSKLWACTTQL